jgi:hypothetical protein
MNSQELLKDLDSQIESVKNPEIINHIDDDESLCGYAECLNSKECKLINPDCKHNLQWSI